MDWQEVSVKTIDELTDAVSNVFYDLGSGGVVIEDPKAYIEYITAGEWDYHAIPEELLSREFVIVKGYLPVNEELVLKEEELRNRLAELSQLFPYALLEISSANVKEEDWAHAWKAFYKPHKIGGIVVKPTWEDYIVNDNEIIIELDPGMAFGTGTHPTTFMVLELLQELPLAGKMVADIGTGSGILAIATAKLGAQKVYAYDIDSVATKVALENVELNEVCQIVEVQVGDLLKGLTAQMDIIIANIVADVIIRLFSGLDKALVPGGYLVASGIIKDRLQDVLFSAQEHQLEVVTQKNSGEWVALVLTKVSQLKR